MEVKTIAPHWLALSMLPVLAAALFMVSTEAMMVFVRFAEARNYDELSTLGIPLSWGLAPLLTTVVFAYPVARLYSRYSFFAGVLIGLPTLLYRIFPVGNVSDLIVSLVLSIPLGLLLPVTAWLAHRALASSRLAVLTMPCADAGDATSKLPESVAPRKLMLILLPLLAIGLFILHDVIQPAIYDFAFRAGTHALRMTELLFGAFVSSALMAMFLAYPVARIYGRRAVLVGLLIPIPTVWHWSRSLFDGTLHGFGIAGYSIELVSLSVLIAIAAWQIHRKLQDSQLVIVTETTPAADALERSVGAATVRPDPVKI